MKIVRIPYDFHGVWACVEQVPPVLHRRPRRQVQEALRQVIVVLVDAGASPAVIASPQSPTQLASNRLSALGRP